MKFCFYFSCILLFTNCSLNKDVKKKVNSNKENAWHFSDASFTYEVIYDTIAYAGNANLFANVVRRVDVISKGKLIQSIPIEEFMCERYLDSTSVFIVEDINFDGHNDLRVINWLGTRSDKEYRYWIYDTKTEMFNADTTLNDFMNPSFDQNTKTIYTHWRYGINEEGHAIYNWQNGKCNLLIEEIMSVGPDPAIPPSLYSRKLIDGEFKCKWEDAPEYVQVDKGEIYAMLISEIINQQFSNCDRD